MGADALYPVCHADQHAVIFSLFPSSSWRVWTVCQMCYYSAVVNVHFYMRCICISLFGGLLYLLPDLSYKLSDFMAYAGKTITEHAPIRLKSEAL